MNQNKKAHTTVLWTRYDQGHGANDAKSETIGGAIAAVTVSRNCDALIGSVNAWMCLLPTEVPLAYGCH